jgi:hypothetical protein
MNADDTAPPRTLESLGGFYQHDSERCSLLLATVILLVLLVFALWAWQRNRRQALGKPERFMPDDAATPKLKAAVARVAADLCCVTGAGRRVLAAASTSGDDALEDAAAAVSRLVDQSEYLRQNIKSAAPTYQNVLALYSGLAYSDEAYAAAAKTYAKMGEALCADGSPARREAGHGMRQLSACYASLTRAVHGLGADLGLE